MRKALCFIAIIVLSSFFALTVFAAPQRVVDSADLLDSSQEVSLTQKLDGIAEKYQCDIAVVTVNSLDGKTATAYVDDYYDQNGYGIGTNKDGIMLLISMEDRDFATSTCGYGITAFTDYGLGYIEDQMLPYLKNNEYNDAFNAFADTAETLLIRAQQGTPVDVNSNNDLPTPERTFGDYAVIAIISAFIGLFVALIVTLIMRRQLKSVRAQNLANSYVRTGSMNITRSLDTFMYKNVTSSVRQTSDSGGSSTHTSSSGTTHGGSSGKF